MDVATTRTASGLVGRATEVKALDDLFDQVRGGGGALVVRGEAGVGKSALLREAGRRAAARGMLVLATTGVQSEARLAFAGLHQLLHPILADIDALRPHQRDALLAAFGLAEAEAEAPDLFPLALATLEMLSERAAHCPMLLLVEDVDWLDGTTADVLAFVARRLESDPIVLLAAGRDGRESPLDRAGLAQLRLAELGDDDASALLDAHAPDLEPALRERLLAEAQGNPLALVELPIASRRLREATLLPTWLPLTTRLERAFATRAVDLPTSTRTLLLVAALNDADGVGEILDATSIFTGLPLTAQDLAPAESAGLIDLDDRALRFRHPLVRSAIVQAASLSQRTRAHGALADVLAGEPDRRVRHRAASILGPDEEIAGELERAATRAQRRPGIAAAVATLERAAQLSDVPARRGARLLHAAELAFELGRRDVVVRLLEEVEPLELECSDRGRLVWLREFIEERMWSGSADAVASIAVADQVHRDGNLDRALDSLMMLALRCWWSNPDEATRELVVGAAERLPVRPDDPKLIAILALADPARRTGQVIERLEAMALDPDGDPEVLRLLGTAANSIGAWRESERFLAGAIDGLRAEGRLGLLARALVSQSWTAIHLGTWSLALSAAEEAGRLTRETAQPRWEAAAQLAEAALAGMRGDTTRAERLIARAERVLLPMGSNPMLAMVQLARGAAALGAGQHADAYEHVRRMFDPVDIAYHPVVRCWATLDLVDAAVHSDHHDEARAIIADLEGQTRTPLLDVGLGCARALLAEDVDAEALFDAALTPELAGWPFLRARLLLAQGAWLRRRRRAVDSRAPLRGARDAFDALGAIPWGERARQELRASGETSRQRTPDVRDRLTPQELQIARMAAEGLSNRDIGQQLYLSHRTVGSHLYRIFPKLAITSRAELRTALRPSDPDRPRD